MRKIKLRLLPRSQTDDNLKPDQSSFRIYTFSTISHNSSLPIIKEHDVKHLNRNHLKEVLNCYIFIIENIIKM